MTSEASVGRSHPSFGRATGGRSPRDEVIVLVAGAGPLLRHERARRGSAAQTIAIREKETRPQAEGAADRRQHGAWYSVEIAGRAARVALASTAVHPRPISDEVMALSDFGFVVVPGPFARPQDAWSAARDLIDTAAGADAPLAVLGDFVIAPPDAAPTRDFQTLHFDFGLPVAPVASADVARFTALHVAIHAPASDAATRLVPLRSLLAGGPWPDHDELLGRLASYGHSHGAWDDSAGYSEGSLARIVEAALGRTPVLPSVKAEPDFLCGTEFATISEETDFFTQRGLRVDIVGIEVCLRPGELLVFDNLALAHGRRGVRRPGELNQRVFGHRDPSAERQVEVREQVLAEFSPR